MKKLFGTVGCILISTLLLVLPASAAIAAMLRYQNSRATLDITVGSTTRLADPQTREREIDRGSSQLHIDKVSLEVYSNRQSATDARIGDACDRAAPEIEDGNVAAHSVASTPQRGFTGSLHAQSQRTFKLEK
jgi:hypothetical protein